MASEIVRSIAARFRAIQDVKLAASGGSAGQVFRGHEPDLLVETWMNSRLYVYIIERPPKTREIRAILRQNTGASIGTLFLVAADLLPGDGYCGKLQAWQDNLRSLHLGAVYAFERTKGSANLLQINFDETTQRNQFIVWHTRDFPCDAVSARRREVQSGLRGSWIIGDIASPRFKRRIDEERAQKRFHYRTRRNLALDSQRAETINAAYLALEIEVGAGQDAVKEAFRKLAREYHPDVSAHDKGEAERRFKEVQSAYQRIKTHRRWS